jgi:glycosyltransferase involved in cell wall biosynthesis
LYLADSLDDVLKVLNISSGDKNGSRFNGFDWMDAFKAIGVESKLAVHWNHNSPDSRVTNLVGRRTNLLKKAYWRAIYLESLRLGREDGNYPWAKSLFRNPNYINADLIHFQIVHDGTLDFETIIRVMKEKPTLWTWHDPWPLTGHCVYPVTCHRFDEGCGSCPDLKRPFTVSIDRTRENRIIKQNLILNAQRIHISTEWFKDFILKRHPEIATKVTQIPFGLSSNLVAQEDKEKIRTSYGIENNQLVIGLRATNEPQKNLDLVLKLLDNLEPNHELVFFTIQDLGLLARFDKKFKIIEVPWTDSEKDLSDFYNCLDLFLMPSKAETFGFMGLEAQSAGVPVIGLQGTALAEICDLAKTGFTICEDPLNELNALITSLQDNKELVKQKANLSRENFLKNFSLDVFLGTLKQLYQQTIEEFHARK